MERQTYKGARVTSDGRVLREDVDHVQREEGHHEEDPGSAPRARSRQHRRQADADLHLVMMALRENLPLSFFHSARGGMRSMTSQCSAMLPP